MAQVAKQPLKKSCQCGRHITHDPDPIYCHFCNTFAHPVYVAYLDHRGRNVNYDCEHEFVDSQKCLKCGWEPRS